MNRRFLFVVMAMLVAASLVLSACGTPATEAPATEAPTEAPVATEPPMPAVGSPEHPIKVLFVPSVDTQVIVTGGQVMADALHEATGLYFEVSVPTSYPATIEEMCASPTDTIGFIPGLGYAMANQLCGVDVAYKALRRGYTVYWSQVLVPRDSDIQTLADLNGKKWAYPEPSSTSGYLAVLPLFAEAGVVPGETVEAGGHNQATLAVYNGEADFSTSFYSPYTAPDGGIAWSNEHPDIPDEFVDSCKPNEDASKLLCGPNGEYRVLDNRASVRKDAPDIIQKVRILTLSADIPNDTMSFGPDFPADLRAQIEAAIVAFASTDAWKESIGSEDFYGWTSLEPTTDAEYDIIRKMVQEAGMSLEDLGK